MIEKTINTTDLFSFAFFGTPSWDLSLDYLAQMAEPENWLLKTEDGSAYTNGVLRNYLFHTFSRVATEDKIIKIDDGEKVAFHTGLQNSYGNDIYATFEVNRSQNAKNPYYFKGWRLAEDSDYKQVFGLKVPERANYFDKPELLFYNPDYRFDLRINHILEDNLTRFPAELRNLDKSFQQIILEGQSNKVRKDFLLNYKVAIPQFYNKQFQVLLPLRLDIKDAIKVTNALTVRLEKLPNGDKVYVADTILTLDMAYNNARLVQRPEASDWLKPQ